MISREATMRGHRTRMWTALVAASAATVLLLAGPAAACQVPAEATVMCAEDRMHWEATITITNEANTTYTLLAAELDTMRWSTEARLTGLTAGTVLDPAEQLTARATGLPLSTAGATITYTGRYGDGRTETDTFSLGRPQPWCDETVPTTIVTTTSTTVAPTTTVPPTTTVAPTTTTSGAPTSEATVPGSVLGTTTTAPAEVLGETEENTTTTSRPTLARTGATGTGSLALGGLALVTIGSLLVAAGRPRRTTC